LGLRELVLLFVLLFSQRVSSYSCERPYKSCNPTLESIGDVKLGVFEISTVALCSECSTTASGFTPFLWPKFSEQT